MEKVYRIRNLKKFEGKSLRKIAEITGHGSQLLKSMLKKTLTWILALNSKGPVNYHLTEK